MHKFLLIIFPIILHASKPLEMTMNVDFDDSNLIVLDSSVPKVANLASLLKIYPESSINLTTHTNFSEDLDETLYISNNRAKALKDLLIGKLGINKDRVIADGMGAMMLLNDSREGESRRVALQIHNVRDAQKVKFLADASVKGFTFTEEPGERFIPEVKKEVTLIEESEPMTIDVFEQEEVETIAVIESPVEPSIVSTVDSSSKKIKLKKRKKKKTLYHTISFYTGLMKQDYNGLGSGLGVNINDDHSFSHFPQYFFGFEFRKMLNRSFGVIADLSMRSLNFDNNGLGGVERLSAGSINLKKLSLGFFKKIHKTAHKIGFKAGISSEMYYQFINNQIDFLSENSLMFESFAELRLKKWGKRKSRKSFFVKPELYYGLGKNDLTSIFGGKLSGVIQTSFKYRHIFRGELFYDYSKRGSDTIKVKRSQPGLKFVYGYYF